MATIKHNGESEKRTAEMRRQMGNKQGFAGGGRVKAYDAGAASGSGRLEKIDKYGKNAKPK
jgi:hypothetical protein